MKSTRIIIILGLLLTACVTSQAQTAAQPRATTANVQSLIGSWQIDLRPTLADQPYLMEFVISKITSDGLLHGIFYNTPFTNGRVNTEWDRVYFAFTTSDASGVYFTSGYLLNGKLYGTTFSEGRGFVMPWFSTSAK